MPTTPNQEPEFFYQGDTLTFTKALSDYPATDGWALSYSFVSTDKFGKRFSFDASADGAQYLVEYNTSAAEIGEYQGRAKVSKAGKSYTVWVGKIVVRPSLNDIGDIRSQNKRTLDNICAVIEGRATSTILNSKVDGTELSRIPVSDLLMLRDRYAQLVYAEDAKTEAQAGRASRRNIYTRFSLP